ncbi:hypothetical protein F5J12DRAFT_852228 [Pisolithus orientalis]|uniref:uncharacterized protein n=1 Tax=Pisolithus orientalis TaxID=936130 RepID=UPI002224092F|nr:uncharacterized protein F5J12DRAFT_852228 [Pisolithus orientalis]KAI5997310.1 hypothetical protein F5J12DRAFT_852228 [Pisolithus orientalis]
MGLFNRFRKSEETATLLPTDVIVFFWMLFCKCGKVHFRANDGRRPRTTMVNVVSIYERPDAEETMKQWMGLTYTKPYEAARILYMHHITSNQHDASSEVSRHLHAFGHPSTVHVVPTISSGANLSAEEINTSLAQLQRQAEDAGASMFESVFAIAANSAHVFRQVQWLAIIVLRGAVVFCEHFYAMCTTLPPCCSTGKSDYDGGCSSRGPPSCRSCRR